MPLFAIQILLMDYGAETFSAFALGVDTEEDDIMARKPRDRKVPLLNKENIFYILRAGVGLAVIAVAFFVYYMYQNGWSRGAKADPGLLLSASAITYAIFAIGQIFNSFSLRSKTKPVYKLFFGNPKLVYAAIASVAFVVFVAYVPGINNFARMGPIPARFWFLIIGAGIIYLIYLEAIKYVRARLNKA
jgi:Ca2+-transporting ATPase